MNSQIAKSLEKQSEQRIVLEIPLTAKLEYIGLIPNTIFAGICIDPDIVGTEAYVGINISVIYGHHQMNTLTQ